MNNIQRCINCLNSILHNHRFSIAEMQDIAFAITTLGNMNFPDFNSKKQTTIWHYADERPPYAGKYLVIGLTEFIPDHTDDPNAFWEVKISIWSDRRGWDCKVKMWTEIPEIPEELRNINTHLNEVKPDYI